ncbi:plasmid pRiA4b ORF-3 family protein [uncultured Brevundimonas sp.]|uniref:plasmid pRiA4b ORF-3 family protein n=1 Tax=uncultured Brevundimonas sp. TaxID=213418 RepID=UPI002637FE0A|nr:plasmid pRiA4b ORF-3 family protein [uncultured Brevundimonas sp.]
MTIASDVTAIIRVDLLETEPRVWRRFAVPVSTTLHGLHALIQAAMGWHDEHLWEFRIGERRYGIPDPEDDPGRPVSRASGTKLASIVKRHSDPFLYIYDFGDNWRHTVTLERIEDARPPIIYPAFIDGERRCPPEDVGGVAGYERFLDIMGDPADPEHAQTMEWFDDSQFDADDINHEMIQFRFGEIVKRTYARQGRSPF